MKKKEKDESDGWISSDFSLFNRTFSRASAFILDFRALIYGADNETTAKAKHSAKTNARAYTDRRCFVHISKFEKLKLKICIRN